MIIRPSLRLVQDLSVTRLSRSRKSIKTTWKAGDGSGQSTVDGGKRSGPGRSDDDLDALVELGAETVQLNQAGTVRTGRPQCRARLSAADSPPSLRSTETNPPPDAPRTIICALYFRPKDSSAPPGVP